MKSRIKLKSSWLWLLMVVAGFSLGHPLQIRILFLKSTLPVLAPFSFPSSQGSPVDSDVKIRAYEVLDRAPGADQVEGVHWLFEGRRNSHMEVLLPPPVGKVTALWIDALSRGGPMTVSVESQGKEKALITGSPTRNQVFDLTNFLAPHFPFLARIQMSGDGVGIVERFLVRQIDYSRRLPDLDIFFALLLVGCWIWRWSRAESKSASLSAETVMAGVVMLFAFHLRWRRYCPYFGQPLLGDPLEYFHWAANLNWTRPFHNGVREPLYIWLQSLAQMVLGPNDFQFRLLSVILSTVTVYFTYRWVKLMTNNGAHALLASGLMAVSHFAVYSSVSGEKTEFFNVLVLAYAMAVLKEAGAGMFSEIKIAVLGVLVSLTWLAGIPGVIGLYVLRCLMKRMRLMPGLIAVAVFCGLLSPYFIVQKRIFGDPFIALNAHASYYRRAEMEGVHGYGKSVTWVQYLLCEKGVVHLVGRGLQGWLHMLLDPKDRYNKVFLGFHYSSSWSYLMYPFYLLGFLLEIRRKRYWGLWFLLAFLNVAPYFSNEMISPRYVFFVAPFFAYCWASGVVAAWSFVIRKFQTDALEFFIHPGRV